ncbi:C-type lectin domain-containing protein [Marinifilum sp. D737]|uniref:C-type lectin domain-containing protein n=1 Tax=Marinifilum sp. D737 TaxID=2969628 RepID=UPI002273B94C|nr:C-type lectin domain-containing protein [Marinifilum sp. D737]MCY1633924.1 hypothetical protein [Marinifilum sp. D737]
MLIVLLIIEFQASSVFGQETVRDEFEIISYSNNNGTKNWDTPWIGEDLYNKSSPFKSSTQVVDGDLRFRSLSSNYQYLKRYVDLSATYSTTLTFHINTGGLTHGGKSISIQVPSNGIDFHDSERIGRNQYTTKTYDISEYLSSETTIRPINKGIGKDWRRRASVYADDVENSYTIAPSNSPPVISAAGDHNFCEGSSSMPVVETISITDPDVVDTSLSEMSVQISTGYIRGEDVLSLTGAHSSITSHWDSVKGMLVLTGPATFAEFEAAILSIVYSNIKDLPTFGERVFTITLLQANFLSQTGHFYEFVPSVGVRWDDARDAASLRRYYGLKGYLATLTSKEETDLAGSQISGAGWIGASDEAVEGEWRWVTGPEAGTVFWNGTAEGSSPNWAFWNQGEPNQVGNEDYAHITDPSIGISGSWNDLSITGANSGTYQPKGYIVEYGGSEGDPVLQISASTKITVHPLPRPIGIFHD